MRIRRVCRPRPAAPGRPTRCRAPARRPATRCCSAAAQQRGVGGRALEVQVRLVFPGEPDAAVHLDGVGRDARERRRARGLRDARRQRGIVGAVGQRPHRVVRGRAGVLEVDQQVRQPVLDRLERPDGPAELQPRLGVLDRQVEQMLCGADLLDGEQRRTHVQRMVDHALRPRRVRPPAAPVRRRIGSLACGRVRSRVASGVRCTPDRRGVDGVQRHPVGSVRGDQQVVGGAARRRPARPFRSVYSPSPPAMRSPTTADGIERACAVGDGERRGAACPRPVRPAVRRAPAPSTRRPARGWRGTRCRRPARRPARRRAPRPRRPDRPAYRRRRRRPRAPTSPSTPSSAPSRVQTFASNGGSDSISRRTVCSSKFSAQNLPDRGRAAAPARR